LSSIRFFPLCFDLAADDHTNAQTKTGSGEAADGGVLNRTADSHTQSRTSCGANAGRLLL
jgi:hypothetical protein